MNGIILSLKKIKKKINNFIKENYMYFSLSVLVEWEDGELLGRISSGIDATGDILCPVDKGRALFLG